MCRFVETIKIKNDLIYDLVYHNERFNRTRKYFFNINKTLNLSELIKTPNNDDITKCRILYDKNISDIEYHKYLPRKINKLKIVFDNNILYEYKYYDRSALNKLLEQKEDCDDILIVKNNFIEYPNDKNCVNLNLKISIILSNYKMLLLRVL